MIQMVVFNILDDINRMSSINNLFVFWESNIELFFLFLE